MSRRNSVHASVTGLVLCAMLGLFGRDASAAEEEARRWKWIGVWGIPDCVYNCIPQNEGCDTDPDCKCDCFK